MEPIEWVFGLLAFVAIGIACILFGEAFRAHIFLFLAVWLFLPLLSVFIRKWELLDLASLRKLRPWFMVIVVAVSAYVGFGWDDIRNHIGNNYLDGYRHWTVERGENDDGSTTYGEDWTANDSIGTRALHHASLLGTILAIVCPWITWKSLVGAINKKEIEEQQYLSKVEQREQKKP